MTISTSLRSWIWNFLLPADMQFDPEWRARLERYQDYYDYYHGRHRRQLRTRDGQADDNLVENYISLVIARSISLLLGDGVSFELPDPDDQAYIDEVFEANNKNITLYDAAENAAVYGTGFIKIKPFGVESKRRENIMLPRLVVLDPHWMSIITNPEDVGLVTGYEMRYNIGETARRETTEVYGYDDMGRVLSWVVTNYQANRNTGGRWQIIDEVLWEYEFPPIIHWKNLPNANDCYGRSDQEDLIELQDRLNFVASNISKIIRYHAHPKTWGRGAGLGNRVSWGADEIVMVNGQDAMLQNLEMQSDLVSSQQFHSDLRTALMEISRTVDLTSMKDKVGSLTNFGLRVLYNDALDKNSTKRDNMGEMLRDLIHRLLVLDNRTGDPGRVIWPDPLPIDKTEALQADGFDLEHGLVSRQTIAQRRGYNWEVEQERIAADKTSDDNIGAALLRAFDRGGVSGGG